MNNEEVEAAIQQGDRPSKERPWKRLSKIWWNRCNGLLVRHLSVALI